MSFKTKEAARAYRQRKDVQDKHNSKAREKYVSDPEYRKKRIEQATAHRQSDLGMIMSRLRINNYYARKNGYAQCPAKAKDVLELYTGNCFICKDPYALKELVIDHNHETGDFRGWLCASCNVGLGYFQDSPYRLTLAIAYLHKTETVNSAGLIGTKDSNPKDLIGSSKLPLSIVPGSTKAYLALGHLEGHTKYGYFNWRHAGVKLSIYLDALERHIEKLKGGEWEDKLTRVPHIANAITCISIIIDAHECGKLVDDRPSGAPISEIIDRMSDNVVHIKKLFEDKKPIDYFITGPKQRT
jgi:hypothetical protein